MEQTTEKKIGTFKNKVTPVRFITIKNNTKIKSNVALISGKELSSEDLKDMTFKLEILDDNTFNFTEIDGKITDHNRLSTLVDIILSKDTQYAIDQQIIIGKLKFHSEDDKFSFHLVVSKEKPFDKLKRFMSEVSDVRISSDKKKSLKDLLGDDEPEDEITESPIEKEVETLEIEGTPTNSIDESLKSQFDKINENTLNELKERKNKLQVDIIKKKFEVNTINGVITTLEKDLSIVNTRIDNLTTIEKNGFRFKISEALNDGVSVLSEETENLILNKLSKVPNINAEAFIKLLKSKEFEITFYQENVSDSEVLNEELNKTLEDNGITLEDNVYKFIGDKSWHQLKDVLIKLGFSEF